MFNNQLLSENFFSPVSTSLIKGVIKKAAEVAQNKENENKLLSFWQEKTNTPVTKARNKMATSEFNFPEPKAKVLFQKNEIKGYQIDDQGNTNACGTTSLTSIMNYYGEGIRDHWEIDQSIRSTRFDLYTSPGDIISYARNKGYNAGMKNNGSLEDLATYIDQGVPVLTLIDSTPNTPADTGLHWEVIVGYERNSEGKINEVKIADPSYGGVYSESAKSFQKDWANVKVGEDLPILGKRSVNTGYNSMFIVIAPPDKTITAPNGSQSSGKNIKIPHDGDTTTGQVAQFIARTVKQADDVISYAEDSYKTVVNFVDTAGDYVEETYDAAVDVMASSIETVGNTVGTVYDGATSVVTGAVSWAKSWF